MQEFCFFKICTYLCSPIIKSRSGAVVARWAHNPKVVSSSLASATRKSVRGLSGAFFIGHILIFDDFKKTTYFCIGFCFDTFVLNIFKVL